MIPMKKIVIGTGNRHKFAEIADILMPAQIGVELLLGGDLVDRTPDETGKDFYENALLKARYYCEKTGYASIADDSGLMVEALDGAPGLFSARYSGEVCTYSDNNRKLLTQLADVPAEKRAAKFICTAILYLPDGRSFSAVGIIEGKIAFTPRGAGGFGYDPIFELPDGRTIAELPDGEKSRISHRAKAFSQMREIMVALKI
jgi:XTP/dITP diphosphohydrolase